MEFNRIPQCQKCLDPPLRPENRDAIRIWHLTESQVITGGMGAVFGINHMAVWAAIDRYPIRHPVQTFEKVLRLFSEISMEEMRAKSGD